MTHSSEKQIEEYLKSRRKRKMYFTSYFRNIVPESAIRMALSRLVRNKVVCKLYANKIEKTSQISL